MPCTVAGEGKMLAVQLSMIAIVAVFALRTAHALEPNTPPAQFRRDVWRVRDGLPSDTVRALRQTRDGYLWIGTQDGLARFDGSRFTVFDASNTPELRDHDITALLEDRAGVLWIGTNSGGLSQWAHGKMTAVSKGLPSDYVRALAATSEGVWVGGTRGVVRVAPPPQAGSPAPERLAISALAVAPDGELWVASAAGLHIVALGGQLRPGPDGLPGAVQIRALHIDDDGTVWVGLREASAGLWRLRQGSWRTYTEADGLPSNNVSAVLRDRRGMLWVGTEAGLARADGEKLTPMAPADGRPADAIRTLHEDREGGLWIGTMRGGLQRLSDRPFRVLTAERPLGGWGILGLCRGAPAGQTWVSTDRDGLAQVRGDELHPIEGLTDPRLICMGASRRGGLWLLQRPSTLIRWDGEPRERLTVPGAESHARAVLEDRAGRLWVAGEELFRLDGGRLVPVTQGLGRAAALHEGRDGSLWVGIRKGLARVSTNGTRRYDDPTGALTDIVALAEDPEGTMWVAAERGGLGRLVGDELVPVTARSGMPGNYLHSLVRDGQDRFWMRSRRGVFWLAWAELDAFTEGRIEAVAPVLYGPPDGLPGALAPHYGPAASLLADDGRLWFAAGSSLVAFHPARVVDDRRAPPVVIEEALVDERRLDIAAATIAPPGNGTFEVRYSALTFTAPEKIRFRHRLDGYETDWVDGGDRRWARYPRLPPGAYRFVVAARQGAGPWSQADAAVAFSIAAPLHRTDWFRALVATTVLLLLLGAYRMRGRALRARFEGALAERGRIAREMHDTLSQGFVAASVQLERVKRALELGQPDVPALVDETQALVRDSLGEARRAIWALRPELLERGDLPAALTEIARLVAGSRKISVQVKGAPRRLPSPYEENLLRLGQEALTNAVRHADAQEIAVTLAFERRRVRMTVKDDGHGMPSHPPRDGEPHQGMGTMRTRAVDMGAELQIDSSPRGTTISVEVIA